MKTKIFVLTEVRWDTHEVYTKPFANKADAFVLFKSFVVPADMHNWRKIKKARVYKDPGVSYVEIVEWDLYSHVQHTIR